VTALDSGVPVSLPPRRPRRFGAKEVQQAATAAGASVLGVAALFAVTPLSGALGFVIVAYVGFLAVYGVVAARADGELAARDRLARVMVATAALATFIPLLFVLGYVLTKGLEALSASFFSETLEAVGPLDPATTGGARHALIGTLEQVAIATVLSVPLGVMTAVYINEYGGQLARIVRFLVDAMSGIPSIVAGLFIFTFWVLQLGRGFSGMAAGLALAVLMLPTVTRTSEEMLKLVPGGLREASLALGAPEWRTVMRVVLPAARTGLITAVVLGIARVAGETAPLLLTAFGSDSVNTDPLNEPQSALPLFIYQQIRNPGEAPIARAWTGALVLVVMVLALFTLARVLGTGRRKATDG